MNGCGIGPTSELEQKLRCMTTPTGFQPTPFRCQLMPDLSPAAQAILDAVKHYETNHWCHVNEVAAIILRAAADQVAPSDAMVPRNYIPMAIECQRIRAELLAIADELEAINFKRNKIKKQSKEVADYMESLTTDE